jgi:hypothetical protein
MMKRTLGIAVLAIVGLFVAINVNAEEKKEELKPINDKCPMNGKAVNPDKTIDIKIGLCCENCQAKFEKDIAANIGKVKDLEKCPFSGKEAKAFTTVQVAFCCGNCQGKAKKDPAAVLAKVKVTKKDE